MRSPSDAEEIARLEHELSILRERYAAFELGARRLHRMVWMAAALVIVIGAVVFATGHDEGFGILVLGIGLAGLAWAARTQALVDLVSWGSQRNVEAPFVEQMIIDRERQLAALRQAPPSEGGLHDS
jgi:hypothetical protein